MSLVFVVVKGVKRVSVVGRYNVPDVRVLEVERALVSDAFPEHADEDHLRVLHCEQVIALLPHIGSALTAVAERVAVPDNIAVDIEEHLLKI